MTSDELNAGIEAISDREDLAIEGGKCIPYVGCFWREVDFDDPDYSFGIIPGRFRGFMQRNKWDYDYSRPTTPEEWATIKGLLEAAVRVPSRETTRAVWDAIQAIR